MKENIKKGREKETKKRDNQYSPCFCEDVKAGDAFARTRLMSAFRVSTGLHVEHRRPKAGDAPHEGLLLKVERREFRGLGFRVWGLGFGQQHHNNNTTHNTHTTHNNTTTQTQQHKHNNNNNTTTQQQHNPRKWPKSEKTKIWPKSHLA